MHHRVIRPHSHDAAPEALMAYAAHPLVRDDDSPIPAPVAARNAVAQQQCRLGVDDLALAQAGHDA